MYRQTERSNDSLYLKQTNQCISRCSGLVYAHRLLRDNQSQRSLAHELKAYIRWSNSGRSFRIHTPHGSLYRQKFPTQGIFFLFF